MKGGSTVYLSYLYFLLNASYNVHMSRINDNLCICAKKRKFLLSNSLFWSCKLWKAAMYVLRVFHEILFKDWYLPSFCVFSRVIYIYHSNWSIQDYKLECRTTVTKFWEGAGSLARLGRDTDSPKLNYHFDWLGQLQSINHRLLPWTELSWGWERRLQYRFDNYARTT